MEGLCSVVERYGTAAGRPHWQSLSLECSLESSGAHSVVRDVWPQSAHQWLGVVREVQVRSLWTMWTLLQ